MQPVLWPCRIVTPTATYEPAHFRWEAGDWAEILDKGGARLSLLDGANVTLVEEFPQGFVRARWRVEGDARWLVEVTAGCGCGGTRVTGPQLQELAW